MTGYEFGDVVLVPFPFTDQSTSKRRPAVAVGDRVDLRLPGMHDEIAEFVVVGVGGDTAMSSAGEAVSFRSPSTDRMPGGSAR